MKNTPTPLPIQVINESLIIDPTSNTWLRWKIRPRHHFSFDGSWKTFNSRNAGKVAGYKLNSGTGKCYYKVTIDGILYSAHRIVYALAHGIDPANLEIDHIDSNSLNNNPKNLRLATRSQNCKNQKIGSANKSGFKGVHWSITNKKWIAMITNNKKGKNLGSFDCIQEAAAAYEKAAMELHGEFARFE